MSTSRLRPVFDRYPQPSQEEPPLQSRRQDDSDTIEAFTHQKVDLVSAEKGDADKVAEKPGNDTSPAVVGSPKNRIRIIPEGNGWWSVMVADGSADTFQKHGSYPLEEQARQVAAVLSSLDEDRLAVPVRRSTRRTRKGKHYVDYDDLEKLLP